MANSTSRVQAPAPSSARAAKPAPAGARPVGLQDLQRSLGNAAVATLVAQGSPVTVQRDAVDDARELLSYGVFDWAITDSDATKAFNLLAGYKGSRIAALSRLGEKYVTRLFDNLPRKKQKGDTFVALLRAAPKKSMHAWLDDLPRGKGLSKTQKRTIRKLFKTTTDGEIALLKKLFEIRFGVETGADTSEATGVDWDAPGLRRSWDVLMLLPPAAVEGNKEFKKYLRYDKGGGMGGGYYQGGGSDIVSLNYTSGDASMTQANVSEAGDSLQGVNRFNKVVRHEVGHAVDAKMGWSDGSEPGKTARGGWKTYGSNTDTAFAEMIAASAGGISALTADQQADVIKDMKWCAANKAGSSLALRIKARAWWAKLKPAEKTAVENDKVITAMSLCLVGKDPWYKAPNGGTSLGGRVYQESYEDDWSSYDQSTRARKVSQYQFRAPGEWFAEAYAAYYEPDDRGQGAKLSDNDPPSKTYFDETVDKIK